jgi:hypothetical protein
MRKYSREILIGALGSLLAASIWALAAHVRDITSIWSAILIGLLLGVALMALVAAWFFRANVGFADRIEGSAYEFQKLLTQANKSIFVIGPSLGYLTQYPIVKELLFQKLSNLKFSASILLCDPASATSQLWNEIGYGRNFSSAIMQSLETFQTWIHPKERPNLTVKVVGLVTASLVFIDAEDDKNGRLLIIPLPWRVSGQNRPCFMISKRFQKAAFNTYYDSYRNLFESEIAKAIEEIKTKS